MNENFVQAVKSLDLKNNRMQALLHTCLESIELDVIDGNSKTAKNKLRYLMSALRN